MNRPSDRRLAVDTLITTVSGLCLGLAVVSFAAQHPLIWTGLTHIPRWWSGLVPVPHARCWLCGMSRAFVALWQGDFSAAAAFNPHALWVFGAMLGGIALGGLHWSFRLAAKRFSDARLEVAHE
jgi:hypothetical protein